MNKPHRELAVLRLREALPPWSVEHLDPALAGDLHAAASLVYATPNALRGDLACILHRVRAPRDAFRVVLPEVWDHDHAELVAAAGHRRTLEAMFRYAAFTPPDWVPAMVRVWRGTDGMSLSAAKRGLSWTLDRDLACWFATRYSRRFKPAGSVTAGPLVLVAEVPRERVALFWDGRNERECVIFDVPEAAIDGDPDEWVEAGERKSEAMHAEDR